MQKITLRLENVVADWVRAEAVRLGADASVVIRSVIHQERDRLRKARRLSKGQTRGASKARKGRSR